MVWTLSNYIFKRYVPFWHFLSFFVFNIRDAEQFPPHFIWKKLRNTVKNNNNIPPNMKINTQSGGNIKHKTQPCTLSLDAQSKLHWALTMRHKVPFPLHSQRARLSRSSVNTNWNSTGPHVLRGSRLCQTMEVQWYHGDTELEGWILGTFF